MATMQTGQEPSAATEHEAKRIARQWEREVDDEIRRLAQRKHEGSWKIVVWIALWLLWLAALAVVIGSLHRFLW